MRERCSRSFTDTVLAVSELLPNLDALLDSLNGEGPAVQDARELAAVGQEAATEDALHAALADVLATWRRC